MTEWDRIAEELQYTSVTEMWQKLYAQYSLSQLAARFNVTPATIRNQLQRAGVERRARGGPNNLKLTDLEVIRRKVEELGVQAVATELQVDKSTLYKALFYKHKKSSNEPPETPETP